MSLKSSWKTGNFDKMLVKMNKTNGVEVKVGIVTPKMHYRKGRSAIPMAQIYQWVDEGTGNKKPPYTPPRPTLKPTFDKYNRLLSEWFADDLIRNAILPQGNITRPLQRVGAEFSKLVKAEIMNLSSPKLRPYTIRNRVNKGTTNPLVDTGQLMNAISYSIKY